MDYQDRDRRTGGADSPGAPRPAGGHRYWYAGRPAPATPDLDIYDDVVVYDEPGDVPATGSGHSPAQPMSPPSPYGYGDQHYRGRPSAGRPADRESVGDLPTAVHPRAQRLTPRYVEAPRQPDRGTGQHRPPGHATDDPYPQSRPSARHLRDHLGGTTERPTTRVVQPRRADDSWPPGADQPWPPGGPDESWPPGGADENWPRHGSDAGPLAIDSFRWEDRALPPGRDAGPATGTQIVARPVRTPRALPAGAPPETDDDRDYPAVMWWTAIWYVVPALIYAVWTFTLSGSRPRGCTAAAGASCASPQARAVDAALHHTVGILVAAVLCFGVAWCLRRLTLSWRAIGIGFAATVVGTGLTTMIGGLFG